MLRFRDYSIARKLTSMNLLVSGAALLLAGGAFGAYELIAFRETLVANLSIQAQIVGSNSISALLFNDPASAEKTLSALQAAPHIEYASIYTPDGQPFAAYWRDPRRRAASLPSIPATQTKIHWFRDRQITVVRPIVFQGKPAGMVCIQSDLGEWTERLQRYAVIVAGVLLVSLMAAWLTSSVIRRSIAEPIVGLAETARVVSRERNYSVRAPLSSNRDELAVLIATFNEMLAQIQERDTTLRSEIAERKRLEEARERLAAVVESSDDAIISKTLEGTISTWNRGAEKVFGYAASEIVGKPMLTLIPPDRVDEEPAILAHIRRGESVEHFETVRVRKDGKKIDISATISPVRDGSGTIVGASKIARDITERKQVEERLARQTDELSRQADELVRSRQALETQTLMLQSVLDSMAEGLVAADEQGKFIIWNPAAARMLGLSAANLPAQEWAGHYGLYLEDTVTPFPADQLPLVRAIRGESSTVVMYVRNPELEHGTWIEVGGGPLKNKDGVVRGGVVAFRDISQKRADELEIRKLNEELEERVAQRTAQLEAANHELEAFTYSVSHDLRAPLRHIGGFSRILTEDFGPAMAPEARQHLSRIEEGAHRMGLLVDELLNLARVGRHALKLQSTNLHPVVEEVVSLLQPEAEGRAVCWRIAEFPPVECDPVLVKQVFQNLIANALKFTRTRQQAIIEISHRQENGERVIAIRDNGVGFNMKYQDKLFGVFQRLHRVEDFEGTGIGLATVHRIIRKHGGRVWAEAELDKGATFYFTLGAAKPIEDPFMEVTNKTVAAGAQI